MSMDKARVNRWVSLCLMVVLGIFGLVLLLQLATKLFGPSKSSCTKEVCLAKFLQGPPAFNDEALATHLNNNYMTPPASVDYNLSGVVGYENYHKDVLNYIKEWFGNKRNGVFVDLGVGDGEYRSFTLPLEKDLGWTGLLIEPNPEMYKKLLKKGRKAVSTKTCVSPFAYPSKMSMSYPKGSSKNEEETLQRLRKTRIHQLWQDEDLDLEKFEVQCIPLENLIYAAGITSKIDLLVLDMAGTDLDVLLNAKLDMIPDMEMIIINSNGADLASDVSGYFLERNMVVKKIIGSSSTEVTYVLAKFDVRRDL
ncbi:protein Star-like [Penaeus japonicus]|uniref:protein Star-like n=1 Tax=Penaeus japonicus TaxID=27405 RepID=UPI001C710DF2|nr:protein Star-like [Penaeus japonicus]